MARTSMLFYNQIKKEFPLTCWRKGQTFYQLKCLKKVKMSGDEVRGEVTPKEATAPFKTKILIQRGTIGKCSCSCGHTQERGRHCEHIAALCIYVVEKGSLLRAGITDDDAMAPIDEASEAEEEEAPELPKPIPAQAVAYVRAVFQGKKLMGLSIEAAARYSDPESGKAEIKPINRLIKQAEFHHWKTTDEIYLRIDSVDVPFLGTLEAANLIYNGQAALEALANVLRFERQEKIVLHENLEVRYEREALRLKAVKVGQQQEKSRTLEYEFSNSKVTINSHQLAELSAYGRLSSYYVWHENTLYRFETPLSALAQYANRSGVAAPENKKDVFTPDGYGHLHDDPEHPLHPLAAFRLSLELGVETFHVDPNWKEYHEWRKAFDRKKIPPLPVADYGFELREYQINGLEWMWSLYHRGLAALLADDMGLGKTHQVLAFLTSIYCRQRGRPKHPSLVVAPTSVVAAWSQKMKKYDTGLRWHVFHGQSRKLPKKDIDIVLTTYGILQREAILREKKWHLVILDEAQAVKNSSTISSRAARLLESDYRIAMTGTPLENQSTDLWSIMEFLLPGYLGSLARFKRIYGSGREIPPAAKRETLKRLVSPFLLRRTKAQVLTELPEKTEEVLYCEMTAVQKREYRAALNGAEAARLRQNLEKGTKIDYANILALLTRLKQICDHPRLPALTAHGKGKVLSKINPFESGKWETFDELVSEALRSDLKVVIFTQYLGMMDMIGRYLKEKEVGYTELRGDTPDRAKRLEKFANEPDCKVFVCSLLAGGLGIDLTAGSVCIHIDRWWNPAKENQATDRLHRIGQTRGVQVFKLQIPESVEDRIAEIIQSKQSLSGALIEESPLGLKAFSRDDLLALLSTPN